MFCNSSVQIHFFRKYCPTLNYELNMRSSIVFPLMLLTGLCDCSKSSKTVQLLNSFLNDSTLRLRPGIDNDTLVTVNITFYLFALTELNEIKGYISTIGSWTILWRNEKMSWNPDNYEGIDSIVTDSEHFWKPDLILGNPAEAVEDFKGTFAKVRYNSNGSAEWQPGSVTKSYCNIQVPAFPFDMHTCYIRILSWGTTPAEISLQTPRSDLELKFYAENTEWDLIETSSTAIVAGGVTPTIVFSLKLSRKPTFLIVNLVAPLVCLSILNSVVFLLPQESGERVSFSTTVLLSFTVFLNVIGDNLPKASNPMPLLCYYVVIELISGCIITVLTILCQRLHLYYGEEPAPKSLVWLLRLHKIKITSNDRKEPDGEGSNIKEINTWQEIIVKLDKILFLFFFSLAVVVTIGFIVTMLRTGMPNYPYSPAQ